MADGVVTEHDGALEAGVDPLGRVRVGDVEPSDGGGKYLVRRLWDYSLDRLPVGVVEDWRHDGGGEWWMDARSRLEGMKEK